jgi:hypothetical protein
VAREAGSAGRGIVNYLLDAVPTLLAGLALFGPSMGLDGTPGTTSAPFAMQVGGKDAATTSLMIASVGLFIGLARGGQHGATRLGLGVTLCAFAIVLSALQFVK